MTKKISNKKIIEDILSKKFSKSIKIKIPIKGKKLKFLETTYNNAKAYFIREKKQKTTKENILLLLEKFLNLYNFPKTIECFDISNISQTDIVGSMVTYVDGIRDKKRTKKFIIKTKDLKGDCPALKEILTRHYSKVENFCDLTIIDGAKAQLNAAKQVFDILNIASIDLISIAKDKQKHTKGLTEEKIHILYKKEPIEFSKNSPPLFLLQEIRDEAHMVAISFHKKRRKKRLISSSLTKIPGIGEIKYKLLLKHFKSLENLKKATRKDLKNLKKISKKDIENIFSFLKKIS